MFRLKHYTFWALLSVLIQSFTIIILKYAAVQCGQLFCWSVAGFYLLAAACIGSRVITWNLALSKGNLSDVYVFTALNPVLLLVLAFLILGEHVSTISIAGAVIIVSGIYLQQRGKGAKDAAG